MSEDDPSFKTGVITDTLKVSMLDLLCPTGALFWVLKNGLILFIFQFLRKNQQ